MTAETTLSAVVSAVRSHGDNPSVSLAGFRKEACLLGKALADLGAPFGIQEAGQQGLTRGMIVEC